MPFSVSPSDIPVPDSASQNLTPCTIELNLAMEDVSEDKVANLWLKLPDDKTWQQWFQQWLQMLKPTYSPIHAYELSLCFTTDARIQAMNAQYRQQNRPTDVLAFATIDGDCLPPDVLATLPLELGDIVISVETAHRQALEHGHTLIGELAWLATHGLLHLLGWDHPDEQQLKHMLDQQLALLQAVGFPVSSDFYAAAR